MYPAMKHSVVLVSVLLTFSAALFAREPVIAVGPVLASGPATSPTIVPPTSIASSPPMAQGRIAPIRIDILMLYTPAARIYAGGANAIKASINSFIALANLCYTNSDIAVSLRLAGTAEINYTEDANMSVDLSRLASPGDGYMDQAQALRNTYGADLVCLIRRDAAAGVAGIAYVGDGTSSFSPYAYSVVADVWAAGNIAFPHEVGHNFGCLHDRANAGGGTTGYAYGWRFYGNDSVQYITVMAYYPGTRIAYFSNPSILYRGVPTGVASGPTAADNSLRHEETAAVTARYRVTKAGPDFDGNGTPDILWTDTSSGIRRLWLMNGTGPRIGTVELGTIPTSWQINGAADFDGNGTPDIIWSDSASGIRRLWLMNGTGPRIATVELGTIPTSWQINGAADFDGNGTPDIIWTDSATGIRRLWLMNGTGPRIGTVELGTIPTNWVYGNR
ncbi:hypothetical protein EBZ70_01395 [bacterium]|nr:hypothetical protein [bacterium]